MLALALRAYDQMIGLELGDIAVDGCITKGPCGGECAGQSPRGPAQGRPEAVRGDRGLRHPPVERTPLLDERLRQA